VKYVCVFAHQDDEMRCLGTLLRLQEQGHEIAFVAVTAGDKGLPFDEDPSRAASVRAGEMQSVADAFGGSYVCLEREDGYLYGDATVRRELIVALRRLAADVVFTHWTSDYNPDHVVTAQLVGDAALFSTLGPFADGAEPLAAVPRVFHVDPGPGYGFEATHFVELDRDHVARKAGLIRLHRSQMDVMRQLSGSDYADQMAQADAQTGSRLMVGSAEAFRPSLAERRIPWPSDLPGSLAAASVGR
jgi:LmbE family N-acetylglucosaminyl deacetylase